MKYIPLLIFSLFVYSKSFTQIKNFDQFSNLLKLHYKENQNWKINIIEVRKSAIAESAYKADMVFYINQDTCYFVVSNSKTEVFCVDGYCNFINKDLKKIVSNKTNENISKNKLDFMPYFSFDSFIEKLDYLKNYLFTNKGDTLISFTNFVETVAFDIQNGTVKHYKQTINDQKFGKQIKEYFFRELIRDSLNLRGKYISIKSENTKLKKSKNRITTPKSIDFKELLTLLNISEAEKPKNILLDFFYQACYPCLKTIPILNNAKNSIGERELKIFGIDPILEDSATSEKHIKRYGISYQIINGELAQKIKNIVISSKQQFYYPTLIVINEDNSISFLSEGLNEKKFTKYLGKFTNAK